MADNGCFFFVHDDWIGAVYDSTDFMAGLNSISFYYIINDINYLSRVTNNVAYE
jgi:hypothetical protein